MTSPMPILEARGLVKKYGQVVALNGADFELYPGEILAIIGDNGAGKSTLIKALSGALQPDEGEISLGGERINFRSPRDAQRAGIETVYQDLAVAPALDIASNVFLEREWGFSMPPLRLSGILSVSIGMAQYVAGPQTQLSIEQEKNELLRRADAAMYRAKSLGGNRVVVSANEHVGQVL